MIIGIGTDILSIERLISILETGRECFLQKVYTRSERQEAEKRPKPLFYYATRFAGKEAVFKTLASNDGSLRLCDIEILSDESGAPHVRLHNAVSTEAEKKGIRRIHLSLSYEESFAVAFAVAEG